MAIERRLILLSPSHLFLFSMGMTGCLQTVGRGPDLGACAEPPDGVYTYGEIGIGTCLAGPSDVAFIEEAGQQWLVVTNADPYRLFIGGSVVLYPWDSIDTSKAELQVHNLHGSSLETDPFVGGIGVVPDRHLLLVPDRFSPDTLDSVADDRVLAIDIADPTKPKFWEIGAQITVKDDPQPIVVDSAQQRAYTVNLTDHSISVLNLETTPIEVIDLAPPSTISGGHFDDHMAQWGQVSGGSTAELDDPTVFNPDLVPSDLWSLTFIDGTWRMWVPEDAGLARWASSGDQVVRSGLGLDVDPEDGNSSAILQPFFGMIDDIPAMYFSEQGDLKVVAYSAEANSWVWDGGAATILGSGSGSWDDWIYGATVRSLNEGIGIFYEGRSGEDDLPSIGFAFSPDGVAFDRSNVPIVEPPDGFLGVGTPMVRNEPLSDRLRMWVSLWDGEQWSIGLSESLDGEQWTPIEVVLADPDTSLASPVIDWSNGHYRMWGARHNGAHWSWFACWSFDGRQWSTPVDMDLPAFDADLLHPPRIGIQADPSVSWRLEGEDSGWLPTAAEAGILSIGTGFTFRIASGHEISGTLFDELGDNGIEPGSLVSDGNIDRMYVTTWDNDRRPSIGLLERNGTEWEVVGEDLIPNGEGGNSGGVRYPTVAEVDGEWVMFYAAIGADGTSSLRRAVSNDGMLFVPDDERVLSATEWDGADQWPHSIEILDNDELRIWYTGNNGSRYRIGSAIGQGTDFTVEAGTEGDWQLATGEGGAWDDAGVADPTIWRDGDVLHLWYSGFDGTSWRIGHAWREEGGTWQRERRLSDDQYRPVFTGLLKSFSSGGVRSPIVVENDGDLEMWYAGYDSDGFFPEARIGRAVGRPDAFYPAHRFPTAGDQLRFETEHGTLGTTVIDLAQTVDSVGLSGEGISSIFLDETRGMLFLPSKKSNTIYVVDVRDDSQGEFLDRNYLDLEGIIVVSSTNGPRGVRDVQVIPGTDQMYLTTWDPDAVAMIDLSDFEDNAVKESYVLHTQSFLPLAYGSEDAGEENYVGLNGADQVTGSDMALSQDGRYLWVPNALDNSVSVFDLTLGLSGSEIAYIPNIGELPHLIRMSPDGRFAIVANYVGEIDEDGGTWPSLLIIDADPSSPTWLSPLTRLVNR